VSEMLIVLVAVVPALAIACLVVWAERWRIANDWRYSTLPWRKRRRTA
jgi:hypothetical protein